MILLKHIESIHVYIFQKQIKHKVKQSTLINSPPLEMKDGSIQGKIQYKVNQFTNELMNYHHQDLNQEMLTF